MKRKDNSLTNAMTKLTHKDNWRTPEPWMRYFKNQYGIAPRIDLMATNANALCEFYIDKQTDFLKVEKIKYDGYINAPYRKTQKNAKGRITKPGMEEFMRHAHKLAVGSEKNISVLCFSIVSSTPWFQELVGETPRDQRKNKCEVNYPPKRIEFIDDKGEGTGSPPFSSILFTWKYGNAN